RTDRYDADVRPVVLTHRPESSRMNMKPAFRFDRQEIEQKIDELDSYEEDLLVGEAEGLDLADIDARGQELRMYFQCLADTLLKAGVFKSQQEARSHIRADS